MDLLSMSDKVFWHGYLDFYETFFQERSFQNIAEVGVFKGNSIRWFLARFPNARIYGADIVAFQPEWPIDSRFIFSQLDQGNVNQLSAFFSQANFDLIVEDGSHVPHHQALCLLEGLQHLNTGGLYILEDIHTSHPSYRSSKRRLFPGKKHREGNALSVLLAIDHYKRIRVPIDEIKAHSIAKDSIIDADDVIYLAQNLSKISLYRRTRLPDSCYKCGSNDYDYSKYKCLCGVDVFSDSDSMSFVLEKS